jgi:hypothetical protein
MMMIKLLIDYYSDVVDEVDDGCGYHGGDHDNHDVVVADK